MVAAATVQEIGPAFAVGLFAARGAVGAVFIRFAVAGVILSVAVRPRMRGLTRSAWGTVAALACALTAMNLCFYQALKRIPLGIAVTIEVLGPLILSGLLGARRVAWLWALLAFAGVAMLGFASDRSGGAVVVLHQQLTWTHYLAIVLVTAASIGAVRSAQGGERREPLW